jgi:hypothetical protein
LNPIHVTRGDNPVNDYTENDVLIGGAFPHLFLLGKGLSKGPLHVAHYRHLFSYYDGRFNCPLFIANAFFQTQRAKCARNTAVLTVSRNRQVIKLTQLCKMPRFIEKVEFARDNPDSKEAKLLNRKVCLKTNVLHFSFNDVCVFQVCHILSLVGSTIPFSPFERAASRPKMLGLGYRFGAPNFFMTGAPPEF